MVSGVSQKTLNQQLHQLAKAERWAWVAAGLLLAFGMYWTWALLSDFYPTASNIEETRWTIRTVTNATMSVMHLVGALALGGHIFLLRRMRQMFEALLDRLDAKGI